MRNQRGRRGWKDRTYRPPSEHVCNDVKRILRKEVIPLLGTLKVKCDELAGANGQVARDVELIAQSVSRWCVSGERGE